jgi:ubiquitin-conjugating enzyme E2 D/E
LDILKGSWSASLTLEKVMLSISSLLNDPNPDDPLRSQVASLFKRDRKKYDEIAKEFTEKHAY